MARLGRSVTWEPSELANGRGPGVAPGSKPPGTRRTTSARPAVRPWFLRCARGESYLRSLIQPGCRPPSERGRGQLVLAIVAPKERAGKAATIRTEALRSRADFSHCRLGRKSPYSREFGSDVGKATRYTASSSSPLATQLPGPPVISPLGLPPWVNGVGTHTFTTPGMRRCIASGLLPPDDSLGSRRTATQIWTDAPPRRGEWGDLLEIMDA
jgi:hypothetical protein